MKAASIRSLALASLASLAMATSSSAVTILTYGQANTAVGGIFATPTSTTSTRLTTDSTNTGTGGNGSVLVNITSIGDVTLVPGLPPTNPLAVFNAFMTYTNVNSLAAATTPGDDLRQSFSGQISFTANPATTPAGLGFNYLTVTFTDAVLQGRANGGSASFQATDPPATIVNFSSSDPRVLAALAALGPDRLDSFAIGFADLLAPPGTGLILAGSTIDFHRASSGGTFSSTAVIPEPSGLVMAGTAMLASLGCIGWRRRQSSRA